MKIERLQEIARLARETADIVPTSTSEQAQVKELFLKLRTLSGACMQGLDLNPDLKNSVPVSEIGRLYNCARRIHDTNSYSVNMASEIKALTLTLAEIIESAIKMKGETEVDNKTPNNLTPRNSWREIENEYDVSKISFGKKINFITDQFIRKLIFRDIEHAYLLLQGGFYKPATILAGGVIEEMLRHYLDSKGISVNSKTFDAYIRACESNRLLGNACHRLTDSARYFRNNVHLSQEAASGKAISKSVARGAVSSIFTVALHL